MTDVITITLSPKNRAALEALGKQERVDDIINQALRDYIFIRRFRDLRARMVKDIGKRGIRSDDDVFKQVS